MQLETNPHDGHLVNATFANDQEASDFAWQTLTPVGKALVYLGLRDAPFNTAEGELTATYKATRVLLAGHRLGKVSLGLHEAHIVAVRSEAAAAQGLANTVHSYFQDQLPATETAVQEPKLVTSEAEPEA